MARKILPAPKSKTFHTEISNATVEIEGYTRTAVELFNATVQICGLIEELTGEELGVCELTSALRAMSEVGEARLSAVGDQCASIRIFCGEKPAARRGAVQA